MPGLLGKIAVLGPLRRIHPLRRFAGTQIPLIMPDPNLFRAKNNPDRG